VKNLKKSALSLRVSDIRAEGRAIQATIPVAPLNGRIQEGTQNDISVLDDPTVELQCVPRLSGVGIVGSIRCRVAQDCARCAKPTERSDTLPFSIECKERPLDGSEGDTLQDDVGVHFYLNDHVDIEELVQEHIILHLTPFYSPELDKTGRCQFCKAPCDRKGTEGKAGSSGASKQSLGDLLKKAGLDTGTSTN